MPERETILVVDDDAEVLEVIAEMLLDRGYAVLKAASGDEALAKSDLHSGEISLLVTDLIMPGMTGRLLADKLAVHRPGIAVIFMSGHLDGLRKDQLAPGLHYLQKPLTREALEQKVKSVLAAARRPAR